MDRWRGVANLACREAVVVQRRGSRSTRDGAWLLAPGAGMVRWESRTPRPVKVAKQRGVRREIMVLPTKGRTNSLTVPETKGPRVSLFSEWQRMRRFVLLPFVILDSTTELSLVPRRDGDPAGHRRLRVVWPKTRNYAWVDEQELVVEVDTGRIVRSIAVSGPKGERREEFEVTAWQRVGALKLPTRFESKAGNSVSFAELRAGVALPDDVWRRDRKLIDELRVAAPVLPTSRKTGGYPPRAG
ncbi:MAG: hypothetical protein H6837_04975 [Planctomycetes bacterium]|nr:hypothetical protein [Planctomycetota bacterium]